MAFLHKILRTKVYIIDDDNGFIRVLKQVFARGIENHTITSFNSADDFLDFLDNNQTNKFQRNVVIISISAHAEGTNSSNETLEKIRHKLFNTHIILIYNPGELEKHELDMYKTEMLVDDIITKNNFARLRIQNAIRRILSRDDFGIRRKLLYIASGVSLVLLGITVLLFFV